MICKKVSINRIRLEFKVYSKNLTVIVLIDRINRIRLEFKVRGKIFIIMKRKCINRIRLEFKDVYLATSVPS